MTKRWEMLDEVAGADPLGIPEPMWGEIRLRMYEAMAAPDTAELAALTEQMRDLVAKAEMQVSQSVIDASLGRPDVDPAIRAAFLYGRLTSAHDTLSRTRDHRSPPGFADTIRNERYGPYMQALLTSDMPLVLLAEATSRHVLDVRIDVKHLMGLGAVDTRSDGTAVVYFPTPAARFLLQENKLDEPEEGRGLGM